MARSESAVFDELSALCTSPGYVHAIAMFCVRDNVVGFDGELTIDDISHYHTGEGLIRSEISTLIGLLVKRPIDFRLPTLDTLQYYINQTERLLKELHEAMSAVWFRGLDAEKIAGGFDPFSQGEAMREPIFYGAESAYSFQYRDLAPKKYSEDDDWLIAHKGFSITAGRDVVRALGAMQSERIRETLQRLRARASESPSVLLAFTFTAAELSQWSRISRAIVEPVLQAFTLPTGSVNTRFVSLSDFNEADAAPLLRLDDERLILFQHYGLLEALYEAPFFWMLADSEYKDIASRHRGKFAERFSGECLARVFGEKRVFVNVDLVRGKGEKIGEIDILVFFGQRAILVQAKSKRLTLAARKGNDFKIKDDFKKAVQDAYDQAHRCAVALSTGECRLIGSNGKTIHAPAGIVAVYPICIVADHYPGLSMQAGQFLRTQSSETLAPPVVTDVFALDVITEILSSPLQLLSYLNLRSRFNDRLIVTNELTVLAYHLRHNLWVDDKVDMLALDESFNGALDIAMLARRDGVSGGPTPDGILTRYQALTAGRILAELDDQDSVLPADLGLLLLQLNEKGLETLSDGIERIMAAAKSDGNSHDFSIAFASTGLTIHCNMREQSEAMEHLRVHCEVRKFDSKSDRWFGLLLRPRDGSIRSIAKLEYPWRPDEQMGKAVRLFRRAYSANALRGNRRTRVGRNEPCPCGSGRKYKQCCLRSGSR